MKEMTDSEVYASLGSTTCAACGGDKNRKMSHCRKCYYKLPPEMRSKLYKTDGYPDTFRKSLRMLKGEDA